MYKQRKQPCPTCPFRKDSPSGIWHRSEYLKLPNYDRDTAQQPLAPFMCHYSGLRDKDRDTLCQGAIDCRGGELLYLRIAAIENKLPEDFDWQPSDTPVYASCTEACEAGLRDIDDPSDEAIDIILKLEKMKDDQ